MEKINGEKPYKSGFVSIVGRPNVGKSTLMNHLIGQKIAITSEKPQTTRNRIRTVYTSDEGQIVFVDTPGIHKAKNRLGDYMVQAAEGVIADSDVILWITEPALSLGKGELSIIESLKTAKAPVILVINKIDTVDKKTLMESIAVLSGAFQAAEVVPVCAIRKENLDELIKCIYSLLPEGVPYYDEDTVTEEPVRHIAAELIREKALRCLKDEIPHGIAVTIERMEFTPKIVQIEATIICEKDSHKGIIIGKGGAMLKKIGSAARFEIERMLDRQVNLKLFVKVRKDWRSSELLIKNFGYDAKKDF